MSDWQPISSAPRDGTFHLRWSADHGAIVCNEPSDCRAGDWSLILGAWMGHAIRGAYEATHWMPLPPPPKDTPTA